MPCSHLIQSMFSLKLLDHHSTRFCLFKVKFTEVTFTASNMYLLCSVLWILTYSPITTTSVKIKNIAIIPKKFPQAEPLLSVSPPSLPVLGNKRSLSDPIVLPLPEGKFHIIFKENEDDDFVTCISSANCLGASESSIQCYLIVSGLEASLFFMHRGQVIQKLLHPSEP